MDYVYIKSVIFALSGELQRFDHQTIGMECVM